MSFIILKWDEIILFLEVYSRNLSFLSTDIPIRGIERVTFFHIHPMLFGFRQVNGYISKKYLVYILKFQVVD